jgi:hypothetical protein
MKGKKSKNLLHSVGLNNFLTDKQVEEIVASQFQFVADVIKNSDRDTMSFKIVVIPYLGKFLVTQGKLNFLKKLNNKKDI